MPSSRESRAALKLLTAEAVETATQLLVRSQGSPEERRLLLLDSVPAVIDYYAEGSSALALDFYEDERDKAGFVKPFTPELVVADRTVKIRRGIAWAAEPLFDGVEHLAPERLAEVVQLESARPFRDTITTNRKNDPEAVGWKRITSGGCRLCRMLADRGAVYKESTAHFATHPNCHCAAAPVFIGQEDGPEASVMQYTASKRGRSPEQRQALTDYLDSFY